MAAPATEQSTRGVVFAGSPRLDGLRGRDGERWEDVRARLAPRYGRAWLAIAGCYAALIGGTAAHALLAGREPAAAWALLPLAALWIGYWMNAVINFVHEGAHFNLHRDKRTNDRLTNLLLCPLAAVEVAHYRDFHWPHHLHLGGAGDTEVSYRRRPDGRWVLRALCGLETLAVMRRRRERDRRGGAARSGGQGVGVVRTAVLHLAIVAGLLAAGRTATAVAWLVGVGMIYPLCNALRQILEHRPPDAGAAEGDAVGAVTRLFGDSLLARTFGSAGFNRHLLHHWYPSASYTCFDELEAFLRDTPLAPQLDAARTTYGATWRRLAGW